MSADGETTIASGIQAVAGIGPTTLRIGIPQYLTGANQPMQTPLVRPITTPILYPARSRNNECQVLSNNRLRSLTKLRRTAAGPGKYGSGSNRKPRVMTSHTANNRIAAVKI